jgi:hypothetical protein
MPTDAKRCRSSASALAPSTAQRHHDIDGEDFIAGAVDGLLAPDRPHRRDAGIVAADRGVAAEIDHAIGIGHETCLAHPFDTIAAQRAGGNGDALIGHQTGNDDAARLIDQRIDGFDRKDGYGNRFRRHRDHRVFMSAR